MDFSYKESAVNMLENERNTSLNICQRNQKEKVWIDR
jgi:hypothetical protein